MDIESHSSKLSMMLRTVSNLPRKAAKNVDSLSRKPFTNVCSLLLTITAVFYIVFTVFISVSSKEPDFNAFNVDEDIDIVITWINGSDPVFLSTLKGYIDDLNPQRYREYGSLFFCILALLRNAPWIRYIHIVTSHGQVPFYAHLFPHIRIVPDSLLLPQEAIPTFNSHVLEAHIHKIPNLSEKFIYICDDFFLGRPAKVSDFFSGSNPIVFLESYPKLRLNETYVYPTFQAPVNSFGLMQDMGYFVSNRPLYRISHAGRPMVLSDLKLVANAFEEPILNMSSHRTRSMEDLHMFALYYWSNFTNPKLIKLTQATNQVMKAHKFIMMTGIDTFSIKKAFRGRWLWIGLNDDFTVESAKYGTRSFVQGLGQEFCGKNSQFEKECQYVFPGKAWNRFQVWID